MANEIEMDLGPFPEVLERVVRFRGEVAHKLVDVTRFPHPCGIVLAHNRILIRRLAVSSPAEGEIWEDGPVRHLIPGEVERMRADGTFDGWPGDAAERVLAGCGRRQCSACNPPTICDQCGGIRRPAPAC